MLAGHLPKKVGSKYAICILELVSLGMCSADEPYRPTRKGIQALEAVTGVIDLRSRRVA